MFNQNLNSFRKLVAWQKAKKMILELYKALKLFPREELYGLTSQIKRSSISVASNIAEGNQRRSIKDKLRLFNIAQGSLIELDCQLEIAQDLKFINTEDYKNVLELLNKTGYLLTKLIQSKIDNNPTTHTYPTYPTTPNN